MLVQDGRITMSAAEFAEFSQITFAPWIPRTPEEFDAMCMLGRARHRAENTGGCGEIGAIACEEITFENGVARFPVSKRHLAYVKVHGTWPSDDQLDDFEGSAHSRGLTVVK